MRTWRAHFNIEHARLPLRQDLRDAIAEQEASAQAKVERMCGHECENIARKIDDDRAIKLGCAARIPSLPGSSSDGVTMGPMIGIGAGPHDKGNAGVKLFLSTGIAGAPIKAAHRQCPNTDLGSSASNWSTVIAADHRCASTRLSACRHFDEGSQEFKVACSWLTGEWTNVVPMTA